MRVKKWAGCSPQVVVCPPRGSETIHGVIDECVCQCDFRFDLFFSFSFSFSFANYFLVLVSF